MLLISYDFSNDKTRTKFSKFLKKFGRKLQYSVYEVKNSPRILQKIINEIELIYKKQFSNSDSILIFQCCQGCIKRVKRYGYACNEEKPVVIFE